MTPPPGRSRLVLASASPRRQQLLQEAGYVFVVDPADIDEDDHPSRLAPAELAEYLAMRKAEVVAARHPGEIVLAADTVVVAGDTLLGKPIDAADARRMLGLLGGSTHQVITGVAVLRGGESRTSQAVSAVQMRMLRPDEIERYIASGGWRDKAGGYGIQDPDPFVTRVSGSLTSIVGLPMEETRRLLGWAGIEPA